MTDKIKKTCENSTIEYKDTQRTHEWRKKDSNFNSTESLLSDSSYDSIDTMDPNYLASNSSNDERESISTRVKSINATKKVSLQAKHVSKLTLGTTTTTTTSSSDEEIPASQRLWMKQNVDEKLLRLVDIYRHQCDICKEKFKNDVLLEKHKMLHGLNNKFECPNCNRIFVDRRTQDSHLCRSPKQVQKAGQRMVNGERKISSKTEGTSSDGKKNEIKTGKVADIKAAKKVSSEARYSKTSSASIEKKSTTEGISQKNPPNRKVEISKARTVEKKNAEIKPKVNTGVRSTGLTKKVSTPGAVKIESKPQVNKKDVTPRTSGLIIKPKIDVKLVQSKVQNTKTKSGKPHKNGGGIVSKNEGEIVSKNEDEIVSKNEGEIVSKNEGEIVSKNEGEIVSTNVQDIENKNPKINETYATIKKTNISKSNDNILGVSPKPMNNSISMYQLDRIGKQTISSAMRRTPLKKIPVPVKVAEEKTPTLKITINCEKCNEIFSSHTELLTHKVKTHGINTPDDTIGKLKVLKKGNQEHSGVPANKKLSNAFASLKKALYE